MEISYGQGPCDEFYIPRNENGQCPEGHRFIDEQTGCVPENQFGLPPPPPLSPTPKPTDSCDDPTTRNLPLLGLACLDDEQKKKEPPICTPNGPECPPCPEGVEAGWCQDEDERQDTGDCLRPDGTERYPGCSDPEPVIEEEELAEDEDENDTTEETEEEPEESSDEEESEQEEEEVEAVN